MIVTMADVQRESQVAEFRKFGAKNKIQRAPKRTLTGHLLKGGKIGGLAGAGLGALGGLALGGPVGLLGGGLLGGLQGGYTGAGLGSTTYGVKQLWSEHKDRQSARRSALPNKLRTTR